MKEDYEVYVFTGDRDLGDIKPYKNIITDKWLNQHDGIHLFYASPAYLKKKNILQQIRELSPDYIYLNSMFSKYFAIYPLLMKRQGKISAKMVLAPRGMLKESAVSFKPFKKQLFLTVLRAMGVQKYIAFQATDATEVKDIKRYFGEGASINYIPNFPGIQQAYIEPPAKQVGELKMVFVGRIHPIKNLDLLLQCLQTVRATIRLTIVGAIEDAGYWQQCDKLIDSLPENIMVKLVNDVPHQELELILLKQHLFCLPTRGENFGHAIFEALAAGRPVLISDQTPWRNLESRHAGWDLSLNDALGFTTVIEKVATMTQEELNEWSKGAWQYCSDYIQQSDIKSAYYKLFG